MERQFINPQGLTCEQLGELTIQVAYELSRREKELELSEMIFTGCKNSLTRTSTFQEFSEYLYIQSQIYELREGVIHLQMYMTSIGTMKTNLELFTSQGGYTGMPVPNSNMMTDMVKSLVSNPELVALMKGAFKSIRSEQDTELECDCNFQPEVGDVIEFSFANSLLEGLVLTRLETLNESKKDHPTIDLSFAVRMSHILERATLPLNVKQGDVLIIPIEQFIAVTIPRGGGRLVKNDEDAQTPRV